MATVFQRKTIIQTLTVLALLVAPFAASSADRVVTKGRHSDQELYRIASCAAPPGGACQTDIYKWSAAKRTSITIGIVSVDANYPASAAEAARAAVQNAVAQINGAGAGVRLKLLASGKPDIEVRLTTETIRSDRQAEDAADLLRSMGMDSFMQWTYDGRTKALTKARLALSDELEPREMASVVLKQTLVGLGLRPNLQNRFYQNRSIFSARGRRVKGIEGQDATVLRMHYAP